jgi:hypothetical protein
LPSYFLASSGGVNATAKAMPEAEVLPKSAKERG